MKGSPSPRNCGQKWLPSLEVVAADTGPPLADTRNKPPGPVMNTITSSAFHVAPPLVCTFAATTCVRALDTRVFFKVLAAKNPIHWPSGDQNGVLAPSVPGIACSSCESKKETPAAPGRPALQPPKRTCGRPGATPKGRPKRGKAAVRRGGE